MDFVLMSIINNTYSDLDWVDFVSVDSVTDTELSLLIYVKCSVPAGINEEMNAALSDRTFALGSKLARTIDTRLIDGRSFRQKLRDIFKIKF